jgi:hypothetical protein
LYISQYIIIYNPADAPKIEKEMRDQSEERENNEGRAEVLAAEIRNRSSQSYAQGLIATYLNFVFVINYYLINRYFLQYIISPNYF